MVCYPFWVAKNGFGNLLWPWSEESRRNLAPKGVMVQQGSIPLTTLEKADPVRPARQPYKGEKIKAALIVRSGISRQLLDKFKAYSYNGKFSVRVFSSVEHLTLRLSPKFPDFLVLPPEQASHYDYIDSIVLSQDEGVVRYLSYTKEEAELILQEPESLKSAKKGAGKKTPARKKIARRKASR